uniref:Laminin N-terminal domain-containing protein n=1 Tax=Macrostomum lignano TaxID=282301 RepID=A0A1I8GFS7_9PLAT
LILPALCLTRSAALGSESDCYSPTSAATRYDSKAVFGNHGDQEQREAKYCEPPFENLAVNRQVVASSTCGSPPIRVCSRRGFCDLCDSEQRKLSYSASHLTDYHVHSTCWISGRVSPDDSGVNLTLSLGKKHTVYYSDRLRIGLPDAIEAYKSADFGATWQLWHLFSNNCSADYPGHRAGYSYDFGVYINPREVVCSDTSQVDPAVPGSANSDTDKFDSSPHSDENRRSNSMDRIVLSFSTNFKRYRPQEDRDRDPIIADWMLATDIRLLLRRKQRRQQSRRRDFPAVAVGDAFALSNIDVGGRCFCNGHAARCLPNSKAGGPGASVCDCQHGTEGEDCERCKPFWVDLPWRRGTQEQPTQCRRCQCNGHTDRCHFDASTYQFSAQPKSAGVCLGCRHNTAGRNCQYCRPGYHRNWLAAVDSVRVCTLCNCHPLGSTSGICDRDTGRCVCKSGVGGEKCDRCLAGFEQTSDPAAPCRRPQDKVKGTELELGGAI